MHDKTDIAVLILRFIFGSFLGELLIGTVLMMMIWVVDDPKSVKVALVIGGVITLLVAICSTIWGDKFLVGFLKKFKILARFLGG